MKGEINMKTIQVKLSKLNKLQLKGELQIEIEKYIYGFTKQEILDTEYLIFGIYGGEQVEMMSLEIAIPNDYKDFEEKIKEKFSIDIKILLDK
jgi:hypothetical protein